MDISGFQRAYLESVAPDLMPKLGYVSKSSNMFMEGRFIADMFEALGVAQPPEPAKLTAEAAFDLPYFDLYHDLRIAIRSSSPSLRRVAERLEECAGGKQVTLDDAVGKVEALGHAIAEEAFGTRGVDVGHLEAFENVLAELSQKRRELIKSGYIDLTRISDKLALRASRLSKLRSTTPLIEACRALQFSLCAIELSTVTGRLLSGIGAQKTTEASEAFSFDTSAILHNILDLEEPNAFANRAKFERHIDARAIIRTARAGQSHLFRRAMENIIDNAVKYQGRLSEGMSWIKVRHLPSSKWITTSVENWGVPIHPDEINEIFLAGRRGEKKRRQGDGQGLAIAYGCINALGGKITPRSVPAGGGNAVNTFTVQLPLIPALEE